MSLQENIQGRQTLLGCVANNRSSNWEFNSQSPYSKTPSNIYVANVYVNGFKSIPFLLFLYSELCVQYTLASHIVLCFLTTKKGL